MARSLLFNIAFYIVTALFVTVGGPLLFGPRRWAMAGLRAHAVTCLWLLRQITDIRLEVRGREKLPPGPVLVAAKHQSAWETFGLIPLLRDPALVMKAELFKIPFHGWFSRKFEMISVARETGPSALRNMLRQAHAQARKNREIVIFPEGTRRRPGAPPAYMPGVLMLYDSLNVPCCPVALNSGLFWPRRSFRRYPGTIIVEFLDPIPSGLPRKEFAARLQDAIEKATERLLQEALASGSPPPSPTPAPSGP